MILSTKHIGELEYQDDNVIYFGEGIPGFETLTKFIIVLSGNDTFPFHYLQSLEDANIAFIITSPFLFEPEYDFELPDDIVKKLYVCEPSELSVYVIVNIPNDISETTMNLAAPILVNNANNKACQAILPDREDIKCRVFKDVSIKGEK